MLAGELDLTFADRPSRRRPRVAAAARGPVRARGAGRRAPRRARTRRPQLNGASLVGYPPSSCQHDIEDGLRACGVDPTFVFRTYDNGAQLAMVRAGMGWAVMPLLAVDTRDPEIDIRSLAPALHAAQDLHRVAP